MDLNRLTQKSQEALTSAQTRAAERGHQEVDVEHLLAALLAQPEGLVARMLTRLELDPTNLAAGVEAELAKHPAIAESAVVGIPSREWGETPAAFIVLRSGAHATADDLKAWLNSRVGKTQRLTYATVVDQLPRSSIGKVLKRQLRDEFKPQA